MKLHFLGANRQVTGSRYLLEAAGKRVLIDAGMFQERDYLHRNYEAPPFDPKSIDALLLTHAHLDHCGLIPRLVRNGFDSPIITIDPSADLAEIIMLDSAKIQEEDLRYKMKRHRKEGRIAKHGYEPLYTAEDAEKAVMLFEPVGYGRPVSIGDHITATFHEAGHILGSAFIEINVTENGQTKTLIMSGDVGQWDKPLINDPQLFDRADYIVMESTYGDRLHRESGPIEDQLERIVNDTVKRGGNVVIPTFAVERAQELTYYLGQLADADRIPDIGIYLDSPMAVKVTKVFHRWCRYLEEAAKCQPGHGADVLKFQGFKLISATEDSIALNDLKGSNVIMSSSGMCTGGRIKHHLKHNITRPECTIVFVGYQAVGTLGRIILDGVPEVRILGQNYRVNARIEQLFGLSAHGDRDDLLRWLSACQQPPKHLFLTHGEEDSANALSQVITSQLGWQVSVPEYGQVVDLA
ncbi:MAG: MBL fold metallo-hydrolase [Phycisphaeraceae bacterium]